MTKEEIAQEIKNNSDNKKYFKSSFIEEFIKSFINEFEINDYILNYNICSINRNNGCATYKIEDKSISIDSKKIIEASLGRIDNEKKIGIESSEIEKYTKVNLDILRTCVHELTHACQYKKCLEGKKDLESHLLEMVLKKNLDTLAGIDISKDMIKYYDLLYKLFLHPECYKFKPSERMADIKGLEFTYDISKFINSDIESYMKLLLLSSKIDGYSYISPTTYATYIVEDLKNELGLPHGETNWYNIENNYIEEVKRRRISLKDRLYLGLPINDDESDKIYKKINQTRKMLIRSN